MSAPKVKTVLDSVHGSISIPRELFDKVIDTPQFQRLRRIEQNSCRAVYPSARHDRFIHSLGVYHIGARIADEIEKKYKSKNNSHPKEGFSILPENWSVIKETYKLACLLHDVGHTPFSHTFEEYFDKGELLGKLKEMVGDNLFDNDSFNSKTNAAEHEILSAIVSWQVYKDCFKDDKGCDTIDWILLVRMITGYRYLENDGSNGFIPDGSFENAMIELIHGEIIDADGLDYVCRDVWAGGYRNYNINLNRLISSIHIHKEQRIRKNEKQDSQDAKSDNNALKHPTDNFKYSVVYSSKALNEIETVLNVKNFQYLYVIKHHKVLLEQYYLVEAMKSSACFHYGNALDITNKSQRTSALKKLCDYNIFLKPNNIHLPSYTLFRPTDDDFVALMKLATHKNNGNEDIYINGWFSRQFPHKPLWKSKLEYFNIFAQTLATLKEDCQFEITQVLASDKFKDYLHDKLKLKHEDIIVIEITSKIRQLDPEKIKVLINEDHIPYSTLNHDHFSVIGSNKPFCYVYINFEGWGKPKNKENINLVIGNIIDFLSKQLGKVWKGESD